MPVCSCIFIHPSFTHSLTPLSFVFCQAVAHPLWIKYEKHFHYLLLFFFVLFMWFLTLQYIQSCWHRCCEEGQDRSVKIGGDEVVVFWMHWICGFHTQLVRSLHAEEEVAWEIRILFGLMETQNRPSTGRFLHSMEWNLKRECPEAWQGQPWTFNLFHESECSSRAFGRLDNGHPENSWMTGMIKGPIRHLSLISWYEALVASWLHPFLSHRGPRLLRVMKSQCREREEGDIGGSRNAL